MQGYEVYTDGSFKGKYGSWAYIILQDGQIVYEFSTYEKRTNKLKTNSNKMEFQAVIEALKKIPHGAAVKLYTDSRVLLDKIPLFAEWSTNGWVKKNGRPIPNVDQFMILNVLILQRIVKWNWVKAHSGDFYNEKCDELCIKAREALSL